MNSFGIHLMEFHAWYDELQLQAEEADADGLGGAKCGWHSSSVTMQWREWWGFHVSMSNASNEVQFVDIFTAWTNLVKSFVLAAQYVGLGNTEDGYLLLHSQFLYHISLHRVLWQSLWRHG
jgi:hypothetical protein